MTLESPERGIDHPTLPGFIVSLLLHPEGGIRSDVYELLRTTWSLDDAILMDQVDEVGRSWQAATRRNSDAVGDIIAGRRRAMQEARRNRR